MIHKVDGKGLLCPQPLILTRKALRQSAVGDTLQIECDNRVAYQNILTFLRDSLLQPVGEERADKLFLIEVVNTPVEEATDTCMPIAGKSTGYVVVISSDRMGEGDPELGAILMKGFLNALPEQPVLPTHLLFYNSGVRLTVAGSPVLMALQNLTESGVEILSCGTCLDFYGVKEQLSVGSISNMFTLTEKMAKAGHVVKP